MKYFLLAAFLGIFASGALAHSPLENTNPLDQSSIAVAPEELQLNFRGGMRLTRVTATHDDGEAFDLDLAGQTGFVSDYSLIFPDQGAGVYVIVWRGLGDDGHAQTGEFTFTVE
ncbi:copper resistance protein CopC [Yoonia sp. SDW83-1]|uniref:copper resistance CopC family protein n=1 Tax=Yoonia sp. SDW83-1 TaxID=3366945 RepID=UPI00398C7EA2